VVDTFFDKKKEKQVEVKRSLRFIDSFKFMASGLDKLVKNLTNYDETVKHFVRKICRRKFDTVDDAEKAYKKKTSESLKYSQFSHLLKTDNCKTLKKYYEGDKLNLLLRKGVYPYDYVNSLEKLNETSLPPKEAFYSNLNEEGISDSDYEHAQNL
jgi:hypothetical protein